DASGQRWISIGAEQKDVPRKWIEDLVPPDMRPKWVNPAINDSNTDDVLGLSRINFDGWRWLAFPLPGNYPGEKHPWPANSQWRWDRAAGEGAAREDVRPAAAAGDLPEECRRRPGRWPTRLRPRAGPLRSAHVAQRGIFVGKDSNGLQLIRKGSVAMKPKGARSVGRFAVEFEVANNRDLLEAELGLLEVGKVRRLK